MKNILQSILLFITLFLTIISFTLLNDSFIINNFKNNNTYKQLYIENSNNLSFNDFKKSTNKFIKSNYTKEYSINSFSKFTNKYNIKKYSYILYVINILFIFITGIVFLKNKIKHNLKLILIISSVLLIIIYGIIKVFISINNPIINNLLVNYNYYNLIIGLIIIDYYFVKYLFSKCK